VANNASRKQNALCAGELKTDLTRSMGYWSK
jgi:hypothetical protein